MALIVLLLCATGIFVLTTDARREINALATANGDSTQWSVAQSEVELLAFKTALLTEPADLSQVRTRFDVFYSRVATIQQSKAIAPLRIDPDFAENLNAIDRFLADLIPVIDGPDDELEDALPGILEQTDAIRDVMRAISLQGVAQFAQVSKDQRQSVTNALLRLGFLIFLLIAALSVLVLALARSIRLGKIKSQVEAQAQQRLAAMVSTSLDAIVVVESEGTIIDFNGAAEQIFGYSRDDVIGKQMSEIIVPDHMRAAHDDGMHRYLNTGEKRIIGKGRVQLEAMRKGGEVFPVELSISSAPGANAEIFVSYLRDISGRVAKEAELVSARDKAVAGEKAKAELMAVMSHEMRTPLNGILGALELLDDTPMSASQTRLSKIMATSGRTLLHHVNDVLQIARVESGLAPSVAVVFDPVDIASEVTSSLMAAAQTGQNELLFGVVGQRDFRLLGDPNHFRQIITNLIGNALKFTKNGRIDVELEVEPGAASMELRVSDSGVGIAPEDFDRIFEDFVTLDPSYTRAHEGSGLGLAIVKRLVAELHGEIGLESDLGEGSVFWVKLPLADVTETNENPPKAIQNVNAVKGRSLEVLLVEDNEINRFVANEMLTKLGHSVTEAVDGEKGIAAAQNEAFDVILMDISMPEMDGTEATRALRHSQNPNQSVPIIAVTAHAMEADFDKFLAAGMNEVITKPITRAAILSTFAKLGLAKQDNALQFHTTSRETQREFQTLVDMLGQAKADQIWADFTDSIQNILALLEGHRHQADSGEIVAQVHDASGIAGLLGFDVLQRHLQTLETSLSGDDTSVSANTTAVRQAFSQIASED